jgi:hypothetical protein
MPALNFKKRFASNVESGEKRYTIRARRKDGRDPRSGQTLYLYTGMRTQYCRKLGEEKCKTTEAITIEGWHNVIVGIKPLSLVEEKELAISDGFETSGDFFKFFEKTHGFPFYGLIIRW